MMNRGALVKILEEQVAATKPLQSIVVSLIQEPFALSPTMTPADYLEADYTGYAALTVAEAGVGWDDDDGNAVHSFAGCHFQPTGSGVTNNIFGWIAINLNAFAGTTFFIVAGEVFPEPIPMGGITDAIDFVPVVKLGQPVEAA